MITSAWVAAASLAAGGKKVQSLLYQDQNGSIESSPAIKPLQPSTAPPSIARASVGQARYPRQYANDALNSRLSAEVPRRVYRLRWQTPVNPAFAPQFVLYGDSRIVIQTAEWQMFDLGGKSIAADRLGLGHAVIDDSNHLLYVVNIAGYLAGRQLSDGVQSFNFLPRFGDSMVRTFIARKDRRMLIVGIERPRGAHGEFVPSQSVIELVDLGSPLRIDSMGNLESADPKASVTIPSVNTLVAAVNDRVIVAIPNCIYVMNWNLKVEAAFGSDFEPVAMSLDEAGRIWLVAHAGQRARLFMISPAGEQFYAVDLPAMTIVQPPVIAWDHGAYIVGREQLVAIGPDGKVKWSKPSMGTVAGAAVTADDSLLASEGSAVTLLSPSGERRRVFSVPDGDLTTPPVLTADSEILVASSAKLYCLSSAD